MDVTDQLRLRQLMARVCVITLICISVIAPAIVISPALPYFKAEQLLLPVVFAIYLWLLLAGATRTFRLNGMFLVGAIFCVCNAISMWYGAEVLGHRVILRDLYELPKVWLPVAFFTVAYEAELSESSLRKLYYVFSFAILLVCFYAWGQFAGLSFTYKLNAYYSGGEHIDIALEYAKRVYATMGNANVLAGLMTWCVLLFTLATLFRVGNRARNILMAFACLVTLVMTGSRTGLLTLSLGLLVVFAILSRAREGRATRLALLIVLAAAFIWTFTTVATSSRRTLERYESVRTPLQIDSFRRRIEEFWPRALAHVANSPLVGHGPAKLFFAGEVIDSEYLGVLASTGIIGFTVFLGYYLYPLYLIWKGQRAIRHADPTLVRRLPGTLMTLHLASTMIVTALFMDIWMPTFYTPFLQAFLWLFMGLGARAAESFTMAPAMRPTLPRPILPVTLRSEEVLGDTKN